MTSLLENLLRGSMNAVLVLRLRLKSVCLAQLLMTGSQGPPLKNVSLVLCLHLLLLIGLPGLMTAAVYWRNPFVPCCQALPTVHRVPTIVAVQ